MTLVTFHDRESIKLVIDRAILPLPPKTSTCSPVIFRSFAYFVK